MQEYKEAAGLGFEPRLTDPESVILPSVIRLFAGSSLRRRTFLP
jgi:hypothetical protein